jgi:hypothetical protein
LIAEQWCRSTVQRSCEAGIGLPLLVALPANGTGSPTA